MTEGQSGGEMEDTTCPNCGDGGYRDYMIDEFTEEPTHVRLAVCENRDCRVREFYVPVEQAANTNTGKVDGL